MAACPAAAGIRRQLRSSAEWKDTARWKVFHWSHAGREFVERPQTKRCPGEICMALIRSPPEGSHGRKCFGPWPIRRCLWPEQKPHRELLLPILPLPRPWQAFCSRERAAACWAAWSRRMLGRRPSTSAPLFHMRQNTTRVGAGEGLWPCAPTVSLVSERQHMSLASFFGRCSHLNLIRLVVVWRVAEVFHVAGMFFADWPRSICSADEGRSDGLG